MILHEAVTDQALWLKIKNKEVVLGGNQSLKIYGTLGCKSGKRMKRSNRVFFKSKQEALDLVYRPCGHCLKNDYKIWKNGLV
jgi:methylphosphotriester-DNA--protein-cysteine methyltransferase